MTRVALITIAHGRHDHWMRQRAALARSLEQPDEHILVAMDDSAIAEMRTAGPPPRILHLDRIDGRLPLARARNEGAAAAMQHGADVLIFLDVDCLPDPELIEAYRRAAKESPTREYLISGPVTYLPPPPREGYDLTSLAELDDPHPARPAPARGEVILDGSPDLFWSLSFALRAQTWIRIGGFDEAYAGYGGEDTDFGWRARARGVSLAWDGGARAYHQHHPVDDPPVRHLDDILRNSRIFHERWGVWPMGGWLGEFEEMGLIARVTDGRGYIRAADLVNASPGSPPA